MLLSVNTMPKTTLEPNEFPNQTETGSHSVRLNYSEMAVYLNLVAILMRGALLPLRSGDYS